MGLTFYPIEDNAALDTFRQRLCPFMKAIQKTTKSGYMTSDDRELICDEIFRTARSNEINNQLSREWYNFVQNPLNRTLDCEHDSLIGVNLE